MSRLERLLPALLIVAVCVVYLPSLGGGFIGLDDAWLLQRNPVLADGSSRALRTIWTDFGLTTRLALGAEYLPVRDTVSWFEFRAFPPSPQHLRLASLLLYIGAVLSFRSALLSSLPSRRSAELAALLFALHPVHAESTAWLAGGKDVLALLFSSGGMALYAARARGHAIGVPVLLGLAYFSKSMSIVAPALLLVLDLAASRRPSTWPVAASLAVAAVALAVHSHVGSIVHMVSAPHGGSRWATLQTMGPVSLRYLKLAVFPTTTSLFHHVPTLHAWTLLSVVGYALLVAWGAAGALLHFRHRSPILLVSFLLWMIPLAPASQVFFPLQNLMADRYLLWSIAGPCVLFSTTCFPGPPTPVGGVGWTSGAALKVLRTALAAATVLAVTLLTFERASLFGNEVALYMDAYTKEPQHPGAAYQLGWTFEQLGDAEQALDWYRAAVAAGGSDESRRMAAANLARLLARTNRLADAATVLRVARETFPDDPQLLGNLAEVEARRSNDDEARRLYDSLVTRFPTYEPGRSRYAARYGPVAPHSKPP